MDDIFGQDIKLDTTGLAMVAANGELLLTQGAETGVQDIRLRLFQRLGELFYDIDFGALLHDWIKEESTQANRDGFAAEAESRIEADPRVESGTATCEVISWDETGLTALAGWQFIGDDHPYNLVVSWDNDKKEMVIADVNPRSGL